MSETVGVKGVRRFSLPSFSSTDGDLIVAESPKEPGFSLKRAFFVLDAPAGAVRGHHAHRNCSQLLVAVAGEIEVVLDDGDDVVHEVLDTPRIGLLLPPLIWSTQIFRREGSILLVLADQMYDEAEYIRSRSEFEELSASRKAAGGGGP